MPATEILRPSPARCRGGTGRPPGRRSTCRTRTRRRGRTSATLDRERDPAQHGTVDPAHVVHEVEVRDLEGLAREAAVAHRSYTSRSHPQRSRRDDEARDRERREQHHPPVGVDVGVVLRDLAAQSGDDRLTPNTDESSDATVKIAYPRPTVASTTITGITFGRKSPAPMYVAFSPRRRAACT